MYFLYIPSKKKVLLLPSTSYIGRWRTGYDTKKTRLTKDNTLYIKFIGTFQEKINLPLKKWIYKLWDEKSCLNLLVNNYPWFLDTYNNYKYQLQKVDSMRPFLLYHYGGIYFDMDFKC